MSEQDETTEMSGTINISKVDEKKGLVFGWASVIEKDGEVVVDSQNDVIDDEWELEKAAYDFVTSCRVGGEDHVRTGVSTLVESMVITKEKIKALGWPEDTQTGWWTGWQITDDEVIKRAANGDFTGFSVHGRGKRTPVDMEKGKRKKDALMGMTVNDLQETVREALRADHNIGGNPVAGVYQYLWVRDMTLQWVAYEIERGSQSNIYKRTFTISDSGDVSFGEPEEVKVKRTTAYVSKGSKALKRFKEVVS